jgi:hypothetical protein
MLTALKKIFNNRARKAMTELNARQIQEHGQFAKQVSSIGIHAKVMRADGRVEDGRMISYGHRNPVVHLIAAPVVFFNGWFWNWYYSRKKPS